MIERLVVLALLIAALAMAIFIVRRAAHIASHRTLQGQTPAALRTRITHGRPTIAHLRGSNCAPCEREAAVLNQLATMTSVAIVTIDATNEPDLVTALGIRTVPSTVLLDADGRLRNINAGYRSLADLSDQVRLMVQHAAEARA